MQDVVQDVASYMPCNWSQSFAFLARYRDSILEKQKNGENTVSFITDLLISKYQSANKERVIPSRGGAAVTWCFCAVIIFVRVVGCRICNPFFCAVGGTVCRDWRGGMPDVSFCHHATRMQHSRYPPRKHKTAEIPKRTVCAYWHRPQAGTARRISY